MAKFSSSTFGTISGRHGTAVASTTKDGQSILRIYKAPSNPNTPAQVSQRGKFGFVNSELSPLRDIFKVTYRNSKGMNLATTIRNFINKKCLRISYFCSRFKTYRNNETPQAQQK